MKHDDISRAGSRILGSWSDITGDHSRTVFDSVAAAIGPWAHVFGKIAMRDIVCDYLAELNTALPDHVILDGVNFHIVSGRIVDRQDILAVIDAVDFFAIAAARGMDSLNLGV